MKFNTETIIHDVEVLLKKNGDIPALEPLSVEDLTVYFEELDIENSLPIHDSERGD